MDLESLRADSLIERLISKAILCRVVEEKLLELFSQGKLNGTVHTCIGQEFSAAVLSEVIRTGDSVFSNHRCHGHYLAITNDIKGLIAEVMGKSTGVCGGIGGSQHLYRDNFYSNGIQGGIVPVAAGLALARKVRQLQDISVCMIGDGTLGEGAVYETFNLASKWQLPLLIVLENNGYAQSTAQEETLSGSITERATAFGIAAYHGDTWDFLKLYETFKQAVEHCRSQSVPVFLQIDTFRLKAHSKGDDDRPKELIQAYLDRDPLNRILSEQARFVALKEQVCALVDRIAAGCESDPLAQLLTESKHEDKVEWEAYTPPKVRMIQRLQEGFANVLETHENVYFWGEDVKSPYGGAFKVALGLSDKFPNRVLNTPISEAAIAGLATGMALEGYRPFVEFMFGDFTALAFDQILNHAAKFQKMYSGYTNKIKTNVVFRTPMGGKRCYGPTHSQSLDKHFLGIPGLKVVALNSLLDPHLILNQLTARDHGPAFLIENKILYTEYLRNKLPEGFQSYCSNEDFPTIYIKPLSPKVDVTILTYGGLASAAVEALDILFEEHDIIGQVICPSQIYPISINTFGHELSYAPALITLEEGQGFAGFGSEILAQMSELPEHAPIRCKRIHALPTVIPSAKNLEQSVLPDVQSIIEVAQKLVQECYDSLQKN